MIRIIFVIAGLAGLGFLGHHAWSTRDAAEVVMAKAQSMDATTGAEAGEIAYRVVADRYPLSPEAFTARERLFRLRQSALDVPVGPDRTASLRGDRVLTDRLRIEGDPFVGVLAVAAAGALLSMVGLFQGRSRVRGRSFLLLLLLLAAAFATQTETGQGFFHRDGGEVGAFIYAAFPYLAAGVAALAVLLLLIPVRRRQEGF